MSAELMRSYLDILNEQQHHTKITGDQLEEMDRRGFLRGAAGAAGAAALGAMGLKPAPAADQVPTYQAAGPSQAELDQSRQSYGGRITGRFFRAESDPNDQNYLIFNGKRYKIQQATSEINAQPPANAQWAMIPYRVGRSGLRLGLFMPNGVVYITDYIASMHNTIR